MVEPRSSVIPPGATREQITQQNKEDFADSQASAEGAALLYLRLPTALVVEDLALGDSAARGVLQAGDIIRSFAGEPVTSPDQLPGALASTRPGQQVTATVVRGDDPPRDVTLTLGRSPSDPHGFLGITPAPGPPTVTGSRSRWPTSAGRRPGCMFSLAIIDKLTPGQLTSGRFVAGTGTITVDGLVGPDQGIRYKMLPPPRPGRPRSSCPADNCEEAAADAPDGLQLAKVARCEAVTAVDTLGHGGTPPGC